MDYPEITVTLAKHQVNSAIDAYLKKDFPNKAIKEITYNDDGTVKVALKSMGSYADR